VTTTSTEPPVWDAAVLPRRRGFPPPSQWPEHWPLTALVLGFPLWWVLGMAQLMPLVMALPMLLSLLRRHPVRVPSGFGWWLIFLGCVALSVTMLFVDAPGAVPGGGPSRLVVFSFRLLWYLACTIVLLWVINLDEEALPTRLVVRLMGWMFVITVGGGLLGVLAPTLEFTSPVEALLPGALRSNSFVRSLVHPATAAVQSILGDASPRPIAPFAFANSWGANLSMFLPFFLLGWLGKDAGWRRKAAPVVLALAAVPVVMSLNRGLWLSLALGAAYYIIRLVLTGRLVAIAGVALVFAVAGSVFLASPLGDMVANRLETPHSNDRRGELLSQTVSATATGSPVLGFGSTRDVQGSFASIAGGSRPDCPACSVPPLGTQGQLWLVLFSQGFVGLVAFLAFFGGQLARHWRSRTPIETVGVCLLLFFGLQLFIYDTLGMPMYTLMIAIGLMYRERTSSAVHSPGPTLEAIWGRVRRSARLIGVLALLGGLVGAVVALRWPPEYRARAAVLLAPSPVYIDVLSGEQPREITIDTEASMVFSEEAIATVRSEVGLPESTDVRESIRVTAPPGSRVLEITASASDRATAEALADSAAAAYLGVRTEYLEQRRVQAREQLEQQLSAVAGRGVMVPVADEDGELENGGSVLAEDALREALTSLALVSTDAGELLRPSVARPARKQAEVPIVAGVLLGSLAALGIMSWHEAGQARRARQARGQAARPAQPARRRPTAAGRAEP
jgi:capsular polysaccharide biosynthesis protein